MLKSKGEKLIIYLDQFATSGMFDSDSLSWKQVKELLKIGVQNGKLICPMSTEHFIETSEKDYHRAIILDNEFYQLSNGYAFKAELFITSQLIISIIRKNNITLNTFLYENISKNILALKENIDSLNRRKQEFKTKIEEGIGLANEIRKISRNNTPDFNTKDLLFQTHKMVAVNCFVKRLNDLLQNGFIYIEGVHFASGDIPNWIDLIIHQLTEKHRMNKKETKILIEHLSENGFCKIPTLDIRSSLSAFISVNNKNETANDQIDIMRISTGLPISNILLTDKQRKYKIIELALDRKYDTLVLSGTHNDLERLVIELSRIIS